MMKPFRKFLTDITHADSYIKIVAHADSIVLKLTDCDDNVCLWFNTTSKRRLKKSIKKLSVIEQGITLLKTELEERLAREDS